MTFADEFENYDSCNADSLQIGDLVLINDEYIEINQIEDVGLTINLFGYCYNEDEEMQYILNPNDLIGLYRII